MEPLSYTKSALLVENIKRIQALRKDLLSIIISREEEWEMRWETKVMHTFYALSLYDLSVQKNKVITTLSAPSPKKLNENQLEIYRFKLATDEIDKKWYVTPEPVTFETLNHFYKQIWRKKLTLPNQELDNALLFIQNSTEHPLIQAIAAQATLYQYAEIDEKMRPFSHFVLMLFLYKYGWDLRGTILIEPHFYKERAYYKEQLKNALLLNNITSWMEYVTSAYITELEEGIQKIALRESDGAVAKTFNLSDRQKEILEQLTEPTASITNRQVQKLFKISPITASRDLSKLVKLGLIKVEGKGRAVSYSKIKN